MIVAECANSSAQNFQWSTLDYGCAVDVITDAASEFLALRSEWSTKMHAVITIPILMLWNVRISWQKKLALMSIFSLTIIVIVFSIVRVTLVSAKNRTADISWLYMWSNIEVAVCKFFSFVHNSVHRRSLPLTIDLFIAIVVSCLASFRQLFVKSEQSGLIRKSDKVPLWRSILYSAFKSSKSRSSLSNNEGSFNRKNRHRGAIPIPDSTENIVPLDNVYVSHDTGKLSNVGQS